MDIFAHFFWTVAIYWQHPKRWLAGLIGVLPDFFSFGIFFVERLATGALTRGPPALFGIPQYVHVLYDITHSAVVFAVVAGVFWFVWRDAFWLLGGWILHIIIDMPTHTDAFFPTPFLWPLSSITVSGISWGSDWFLLANYCLLAILYIWLVRNVKRTALAE
jgi:hypothetical protein